MGSLFWAFKRTGVILLSPLILSLSFLFGCTSIPRTQRPGAATETLDQGLDAAQKVIGTMAQKDMTRKDLMRLGQQLRNDPDASAAVDKIIGVKQPMVIKYSPATGKHYSSDLEYDPETGVKLEVLPAE